MARTLDEIKKEITNKYVAEMAAIDIAVDSTTWSATNLMRLFIYVFAFCQLILEKLFDTYKTEVEDTIANKNPHTLKWYANKVLAFQYGYDLPVDNDEYNNTGISESVIEASKVVAYCAVSERADILTIKIAKNNGDNLEPLASPELAALQAYTRKFKDAGVFVSYVNEPADSLKLNASIYYSPIVMDDTGVNISSGEETVKNAIDFYLKNLTFNGEFSLQKLTDELQKVEGVKYIDLNIVQVKSSVASAYQNVDVYYLPASGYLRFIAPTDLNLSYIPYAN